MNVIDTFVVQLGLDPKKFTQGQKQALDAMRELERGAARSGKTVEAYGQKFEHFVSGLKRGVLGGLVGFVGGSALQSVFQNIVRTDAAVGHLSYTMNQSVRDVSAWQGAVRQLGGTGDGVATTLGAMSGEMNTFLLTGQASFLPLLNRLNVSLYQQNGQLKEASELFLEVADAVQKAYPNDPARRAAMLNMMPGMNPETLNLLIRGRAAAEEYIATARRAGTVTEESAAATQRYQKAVAELDQSWTSLARNFVTDVAPTLVSALDQLRDFLKNPFGGKSFWEMLLEPPTASVRGGSIADFIGKLFRGQRGPNANIYGEFGSREKMMEGLSKAWGDFKSGGQEYKPLGAMQPPAATPAPGRVSMTRADRNNNPGNIEYGDFARRHGATGSDGRFAIFPTREDGFKAAESLLGGRGYRDLTLPQIGARWAEGDPNWARNASRATGIPMDRPLTDAERTRLARTGIPAAEGTKLPGAGAAAGSSQSSVTQSTNIGTIVIHTAARDADGIARDIDPALRRNQMAAPANTGQW